jgi:hypothetical protein
LIVGIAAFFVFRRYYRIYKKQGDYACGCEQGNTCIPNIDMKRLGEDACPTCQDRRPMQ